MNIYAISDLHLSATAEKPMNIFGGNWEGHFEKIRADWQAKVTEDDAVLIAGDISWAMKLDDALVDLAALAPCPGKNFYPRQSRLLVERNYETARSCARLLFRVFADGQHPDRGIRRRRFERLVLSGQSRLQRTGPKTVYSGSGAVPSGVRLRVGSEKRGGQADCDDPLSAF